MAALLARLSLTAKAVLITALTGACVWWITDHLLPKVVSETLFSQFEQQLRADAFRGSNAFDHYVKGHFELARVITSQQRFVDHMDRLYGRKAPVGAAVQPREYRRSPPWMPRRSTLAAFARARVYLVFSADHRLLEVHHSLIGEVPAALLYPDPALLQASQNENFLTEIDDMVFVVSTSELPSSTRRGSIFLTLATPVDDTLLLSLEQGSGTSRIVALLTGVDPYVLTSSDRERVPKGVRVTELQKDYLVLTETIYNYEYSDLLINYANLVLRREIEALAQPVILRERHRLVLVAAAFVLSSMLLMIFLSRRIQRVAGAITRFSSESLGMAASSHRSGDLLVSVERQFHELAGQVVQRTEELQRANRALEMSLQELTETQNQLVQAEKMAALGNLVAGVAHEINTPLGIGITAASHLEDKVKALNTAYLDEKLTEEDLREFLSAASESARILVANLNRASDQVRSFKRVAVDQSTSERRRFRLKDYLEEVLLSLSPLLKKGRHRVTLHCPEELEVFGDPGDYSQIVTNLVMNSVVHGFEGRQNGAIRVEVRQSGDGLLLVHQDDGKGIGPELLPKIFDPFFTTGRGRGSTGLGLHILHNIVSGRLGGQVRCDSAPGRGTRFEIRVSSMSPSPPAAVEAAGLE